MLFTNMEDKFTIWAVYRYGKDFVLVTAILDIASRLLHEVLLHVIEYDQFLTIVNYTNILS